MKWKSWFVVGCVGLTLACEHAKPTPQGLLGPDGRPLGPQETHAPAPAPSAPESPPDFEPPANAFGAAAAPAPAATPEATPAAPPRDLSRELAGLLPQPSECLDLSLASKQSTLQVSVSAKVAPTGTLSNISVSAPGQPRENIRCIERRVSLGKLAPDVPDAPLQVEASLSVEVVAQTPPPALPKAPPPPTPPAIESEMAQPENGEVAQPDATEFAQPSQ